MRGIGVFLWQEFRQSIVGLLFVAATLLLWGVMLGAFKNVIVYMFSQNLILVIGTTFLPVIGAAVLVFLQENRGRVGFAFPRRLLVHPVHTWVLVAAPMIYRAAVAMVFALAAGWIVNLTLKEYFYVWPQALLLAVGVAAVQALVCLSSGYGNATGLIIFVIALGFSVPGIRFVVDAVDTNMYIAPHLDDEHELRYLGQAYLWSALACFVYWSAVAYWGARQARREVPADPVGRIVRTAQRLTYFERDRATFPSAEAAQSWFEWRRGAYLFPWLCLGLGLLLTVGLRKPLENMEMRFASSFGMFTVAPTLVACFVGYAITRGTPDYLWFTAARPLTTRVIARARLRAGLKAVLFGYVLLTIAYCITFWLRAPDKPLIGSLVQDLRVITTTQGPYSEGLMLLASVATVSVLAVWTLFWLARSVGIVVWGAGAIVMLWFSYMRQIYVQSVPGQAIITPEMIFLWGMTALLGIAAIVTLLMALRRGYISVAAFAVVLVSWGALTLVTNKLTYLIPIGNVWVIAAWFLLPFVPLASIPLTLEWQRHR